jgi:hypothetical protein
LVKHAETSRIVGTFGEYLLAFILAQRGVHVVHADTAAFDLFAIDPDRAFFRTDNMIGISVKTAQTSKSGGFDPKPPDEANLRRASEKWKVEPWIAYVSHWPQQSETRLQIFLLPILAFRKYTTESGRAMSGEKLRESGPEVVKFTASLSQKTVRPLEVGKIGR